MARSVAADPGARLRARACSRTSSSGPSPSGCIAPLGDRLVGIGRKLVRADTATKIQHRLDIAGNPPAWDVNRIIGLKVLGLGVFGVLGFLYLLGIGLAVLPGRARHRPASPRFGYVLPNILLYNAGQKRETLMRNALPDAMDLLTISVEAGLGFDAAVSRVAQEQRRPAATRSSPGCSRRCSSASAAPRPCAPWPSARRCPTSSRSACAMVQADSLGIPIARVLRIQSQEMRTKRASGPRRRPSRCRSGS